MVWWVLFAVAVLLLLLHWGGPNTVWSTATLGVLIGVVLALVQQGFDWWIVGKSLIIATLAWTR